MARLLAHHPDWVPDLRRHPSSFGYHPAKTALRKDSSIYIKQAVTVVTDTVLLYIASLVVPGIPVGGWRKALLIALFFHLIEWILIGVQTWCKEGKRARAEST